MALNQISYLIDKFYYPEYIKIEWVRNTDFHYSEDLPEIINENGKNSAIIGFMAKQEIEDELLSFLSEIQDEEI